jgi:BASS family bile acid:Na+ symporter
LQLAIDTIINILATLMLFVMMVTIGLGLTFSDVAAVVLDGRLIARAMVANYLYVPAAVTVLLLIFHVKPYLAIGFLIAAVCPGAPFGPSFTNMAKGNTLTAVGLMVFLAGSSAVFAPLLLSILVPFTLNYLPPLPEDAQPFHIDTIKLLTTLMISQLLPLTVGLAIRQRWPATAEKLKKPANILSAVLTTLTLVVVLSVQYRLLVDIPLKGYLLMLLLILPAVATGWFLRSRDIGQRKAMTMATSVRNVGLSLLIASSSFAGTQVVTTATAFAIFQIIAIALVAFAWGRLTDSKLNQDKHFGK